MIVQNLESLQYPIGRFTKGKTYTENQIKLNRENFESFPKRLNDLVSNWDDKILSVKYREGGWNGRQVIHHMADSHANCFVRFKTALIDEAAKIKPYAEEKRAELADSKMSIAPSL